MSGEHIVVGLSGGVDSSVSAWLLKEQGYRVTGIFMKNWEDDDDSETCSSRQDWIDAASAADVMGIELEAVNFAAEYRERVFAEFLKEYSAGRTPNPDILCNAEIKFRAFLDHARARGAARIATGHYARVREQGGSFELLRGLDPGKDQSYFLHRLTQEQLSSVIFPVGHLQKTEVRSIARRIGLANAAKRDSTGICFIGERPFREFLQRYLPVQPGPIRDPSGAVIGEHVGLAFYTLGQRKGIGIGGRRTGNGEAWFVARKDLAANTLWVVQGHEHPWLQSTSLEAISASWISGAAPGRGGNFTARTRYRQRDARCSIRAGEGASAGQVAGAAQGFALDFPEPQWAATPGQSAVLYDGEVCLGGGVIAATSAAPATPAAAAAR